MTLPAIIRTNNVCKQFGGLQAVSGVSLEIPAGAITGLIGANGAGKTTLFNIIAGLHKPTSGHIFLMDTDITGLVPHELYAAGLLRTFQIAREFSKLTVLENLLVAADSQLGESIINTWLARGRVRMQEKKLRKQAAEVMDFLRLSHLAHTPAGQLSGGQKKLVELGRTMMTTPKIVLLDEVGAGVNKTLLGEIADAIARLNRERGYTFFMIEHDLDFLERLCSSVIVMADGAVLTQGTINEIKNNEAVIESYLGRQG